MTNRGSSRHMHSNEDRNQMLHMHHMQTLWIYWTLVVLGIWMIASPLTFDYSKGTVSPPFGREVWLSLKGRILAMQISDLASGILLLVFGWRTLRPNRPYSTWVCCFIGIWITAAPLIFWAPSATIYLNDTLVGAWVIALTILIPGMPNMIMYMKMGSDVPSGWSYNPSSWTQRWILIALGFLGWMFSRYLAAFQMGYIDIAWDPFFGSSTMKVLDSSVSRMWPISDGGLGSLSYTFEFLMGYMGSPSRWRTMPWMVAFFGILVVPLGFISILLVILQPLSVGAWCTICLVTAALMLPMIPLEFDEVMAMFQHLVERKKRGDSLWKVFWKGGEPIEKNMDERSPGLMEFTKSPWKIFLSSIWGMSFPWTLVVSTLLGVWLMFSPAIFGAGIETGIADVNHLGGSLIVVFSVICMGEVIRIFRFLNILLGLFVAIVPFFLSDPFLGLKINGLIAGVLVLIFAIPRGPKNETYGIWDRFVI